MIAGTEIAAVYRPAAMVGGDYYSFAKISDGELGVLIADVTGHGVAAALVASMLRVSFLHQEALYRYPARLLQQLDREISFEANLPISAAYVYINIAEATAVLASTGHPPCLLRSVRAGATLEINSHGTLLGWRPDHPLSEEHAFAIGPGDRLLLYTDGFLEAARQDREMFGGERLADALAACDDLSASGTLAAVVDAALHFCGELQPQDDLTAVLISFSNLVGSKNSSLARSA